MLHEEFNKFFIGTFDPKTKPQKESFFWYDNSPRKIDGPEITYFLNKQSFRSQDFDNFNKNDFNILVGGDSFTFGDGLPLECTWPIIFSKMLPEKNVNIYNTAYNGSSIRQIIKNSLAFIRKYGKPNYLILLMPQTSRNIIFDKKTNIFVRASYEENWVKNFGLVSQSSKFRFYHGVDEYESLFNAVDLIFMLEDICKAMDIKLIWSTYDNTLPLDDKKKYLTFNNFGFENFLLFYPEKINNLDNLPYWDIAADNNHPGAQWHYSFSKALFEKI